MSASRYFWGAFLGWNLVLGAVFGATTADLPSGFDQANRLYEQGQFNQAAQAYLALLEGGRASSALYFNLGNACFKSGRTGQALVWAEAWSPRDPDVRANLEFARGTVPGGSSVLPSQSERWLRWLTLNEWAGLTLGAWWAWFAILAVGQGLPHWRPALRRGRGAMAAASLLLLFCLGWTWHDRTAPQAVIVVDQAIVRHGRFATSQQAFMVRDGTEMIVRDRQDGWVRVQDAARHVGWLPREQVALFPDYGSGDRRP